METIEHKSAGDQIRIQTLGNPYLRGSTSLASKSKETLYVTLMQSINGIPVPLNLNLSAGDIVAMAGDFYTKAGWGKELTTPSLRGNVLTENRTLMHTPLSPSELSAFNAAYADLASPNNHFSDIQRIYTISALSSIPSVLQELFYVWVVKGYSDKLTNNEAHFAPWSMRAYLTGHQSALEQAEKARVLHQLASGEISNINDSAVPEPLKEILRQVRANPLAYNLPVELNDLALYRELGHRYHALAVSQDLFTMHFYSDHYASGHMSRIGMLRKNMPEQFGVWGSILINNMHNEENNLSLLTTNPFQPEETTLSDGSTSLVMPEENVFAYGDGTYEQKNNDETGNMLINGMDNSLGDIARLLTNGIKPELHQFGGLPFLLEVSASKRQTQPLFIQGQDGTVYFRSKLQHVEMLSPKEMQVTLDNPLQNGYEPMTAFKAFMLVVKLRVLSVFYSPQITPLTDARQAQITQDEKKLEVADALLNDELALRATPQVVPNEVKRPLESIPKEESIIKDWHKPSTLDKVPISLFWSPLQAETVSNPAHIPLVQVMA